MRESRWIALSQLLRATPAEFMAWAIRHEHWGAVELFLNDPSITVRQLEDVLKLDLPVTLRESVERRRQHLSDRAV